MPFSDAAKATMLDALTADRVQLHSGAPGGAGTANQLGTKVAATFSAAAGGERALAAGVNVTGLSPNQSVTYWSAWNNNGGSPIFLGSGTISAGDTQANAAGEYTLATGTKLDLNDS